MSVNNEFDEILKGKFDSAAENFSYSEDKWARMEELIMADEARKKRRKFLLIFMGGFMLATAVVAPLSWFYFSNQKSEAPRADEYKTKIVKTNKSVNKIPHEVSENMDSSESLTSTNENKNKVWTETNTLPETTRKLAIFNSVSPSENTTETSASPQLAQKEDLSVSAEGNPAPVEAGSIQKQEEGVVVARTSDTVLVIKDSTSAKQPLETAVVPPIDSLIPPLDSVLAIAPAETPKMPDELNKSQRDQSVAKGFHFGLQAGASYNLGFQQGGKIDDGKSFAPFTGVYLTFSSKNSWSLSTGINYTFVNSLSFQKQVVQRSYDFGYTDRVYELTHKKLNYVLVPLEVSKVVARKNKIGLGVQVHYLMSTSSELNTIVRTSLNTVSTQSEKTSAYQDGLNRLDFQPTFSYERMMNTRFTLRLETAFGTLDVRKNGWTNNADKELNKSIRFIVKYQIK